MVSRRMSSGLLAMLLCVLAMALVAPARISYEVSGGPSLAGAGLRSLNFYLQESPETSHFVVQPLEGHLGNFGALVVIDQPVTVHPSRDSLEIGQGRGLAVFSNDGESGAPEILWTIIFNDPRDNGYGQGSLSFRGSNELALPQRELAIVGGTGKYRLAQGFAFLVTHSRDPVTRLATTNITAFVQLNPFFENFLLQQE